MATRTLLHLKLAPDLAETLVDWCDKRSLPVDLWPGDEDIMADLIVEDAFADKFLTLWAGAVIGTGVVRG